jgi:hypothetical protein
MKLRELMSALADADPESTVVFLEDYADSDQSSEVREVIIPKSSWTCERGLFYGDEYEVRYPGEPQSAFQDDAAYTGVVYNPERVVILSNGPTDLKRDGVI